MTCQLDKPIFIISLHRTGSTLLKNVLNLNSNVAMATDEMDWSDPWYKVFEDYFKAFGGLEDPENLKNLVNFIYSCKIKGTFWKEYRDLGISKEKIFKSIAESDRSLQSIITVLLDEYRKKEKKKRVGVKYPVHYSRVKILFEWYPDAKIIFLVRDARAVCASKLNDEATKRRKSKLTVFSPFIHYLTLIFFIIDYIWSGMYYIKHLRKKPLYKVKYEDLVSDAENYVREICKFCEIPFERQMMTAHGKPSSHNGLIRHGFSKQRAERWKKRLSWFDKRLITVLTKRAMKVLGY